MILGCGRSGTSIFGELFEALKPYRYQSEPAYEELKWDEDLIPLAVKVPRESVNYLSSPGLSFPLDHFRESFPRAQFF